MFLQPMEDPTRAGRDALKGTAAHGEPMLEQSPGSCGPWRGAHTGSGFLARTVACG